MTFFWKSSVHNLPLLTISILWYETDLLTSSMLCDIFKYKNKKLLSDCQWDEYPFKPKSLKQENSMSCLSGCREKNNYSMYSNANIFNINNIMN